jgi:hypothetical protein
VTTRSKLLAAAFYAGAMVIGAAIAVAADRTIVREWAENSRRDQGRARQTFAELMSLTPDQQAAADSIFGRARYMDSVLTTSLRVQQRQITDSLSKAARAEFRLRLTPEQQRTYDEYRMRRRGNSNGRR